MAATVGGAGVAPAAKTMLRVLTEVAERYAEAPEEAVESGVIAPALTAR